MSDIVERLMRFAGKVCLSTDTEVEAADEIERLRAENERLRAAMHDIYEVYAGSEGFIPQTCPEAYLQERVKEMADIAAKHKSAAALKGTGE